jgi:hypothetical protein
VQAVLVEQLEDNMLTMTAFPFLPRWPRNVKLWIWIHPLRAMSPRTDMNFQDLDSAVWAN